MDEPASAESNYHEHLDNPFLDPGDTAGNPQVISEKSSSESDDETVDRSIMSNTPARVPSSTPRARNIRGQFQAGEPTTPNTPAASAPTAKAKGKGIDRGDPVRNLVRMSTIMLDSRVLEELLDNWRKTKGADNAVADLGQELLDAFKIDTPAALKNVGTPKNDSTKRQSLAELMKRFDEPSKRKHEEIDLTDDFPTGQPVRRSSSDLFRKMGRFSGEFQVENHLALAKQCMYLLGSPGTSNARAFVWKDPNQNDTEIDAVVWKGRGVILPKWLAKIVLEFINTRLVPAKDEYEHLNRIPFAIIFRIPGIHRRRHDYQRGSAS